MRRKKFIKDFTISGNPYYSFFFGGERGIIFDYLVRPSSMTLIDDPYLRANIRKIRVQDEDRESILVLFVATLLRHFPLSLNIIKTNIEDVKWKYQQFKKNRSM